jgi:hypothetical protein
LIENQELSQPFSRHLLGGCRLDPLKMGSQC